MMERMPQRRKAVVSAINFQFGMNKHRLESTHLVSVHYEQTLECI
jgi:hypothetical protein